MRPRLVTLRALGLGDLLTSLPALRGLARAFPGHHRLLVTGPGLAPLARLAEAADDVAESAPLAPLPPGADHPDVAVNLHGRGPESHLLLAALSPRRTIAFASPAAGVDGPPWRPDEHEVDRWCRLLADSGLDADPGDLGLAVAADPAMSGVTVVHPGAASAARRWPGGRFAAVARHEAAAGRRVVVTGGPAEVGLARRVARAARLDRDAVLAGRTDLPSLAAVIAAGGRVVCNDTGVAHLATAVGTPSVVLFGPTSPARWGPPAGRREHRALWTGRTGDPHGRVVDDGLLEIGVDDVLGALAGLPGRGGRAVAA